MISTTVRLAQERLLNLGFDIGRSGADGVLGPATKAAVKAFRQQAGLPDGESLDGPTLGVLLKVPGPTPPLPNMRPAPDVLNANPKPATNVPPVPQMRSAANVPPPDQLGTGNTNFMPRLRQNIPINVAPPPAGSVDTLSGPPPGAIALPRGYGRSGAQPAGARDGLLAAQLATIRQLTGNPNAQFNPGTSFDQMQRVGMQSGSRTTEAMQRGFAPVDQGGMGMGSFPPPPQMMPTPSAPPQQSPPMRQTPDPSMWQSPMQMPSPQQPLSMPGPAVADGSSPFQPTPTNPGIGFPGQPPARDLGDLVGTAGSNVGNWLSGLLGKPANAAPAAPPQRDYGGPQQPVNDALQKALHQAAARKAIELQLFQMMFNSRIQPQPGQPARQDLYSTASKPGLPLVYP